MATATSMRSALNAAQRLTLIFNAAVIGGGFSVPFAVVT